MVKVSELALLDLVWILWPGDLTKKLRPALVIAIFDEVERPEPIAKVAYGSSRGADRDPKPWEVIVSSQADLSLAGLSRATRFDLSSTANVTLSMLKQGADRPNLRTPRLQRLIHHAAHAANERTGGSRS